MPRKGTSKVTDKQRSKIAQGKLAGKPASQIAEEVGLAESTVNHQVADPRTKLLIQKLKEQHEEQLSSMFKESIDRIEVEIYHPNPQIALAACNQTLKAITAGDPPLSKLTIETPDASKGTFTLVELLTTLREASARGN